MLLALLLLLLDWEQGNHCCWQALYISKRSLKSRLFRRCKILFILENVSLNICYSIAGLVSVSLFVYQKLMFLSFHNFFVSIGWYCFLISSELFHSNTVHDKHHHGRVYTHTRTHYSHVSWLQTFDCCIYISMDVCCKQFLALNG